MKGESTPDDDRAEQPIPLEPAFDTVPRIDVKCWRCGKYIDERDPRCRFCRARQFESDSHSDLAPLPKKAPSVMPIIVVFIITMAISVFQAWYFKNAANLPVGGKQEQEMALLRMILVVELIDSILVFSVLALIAVPKLRPVEPSTKTLWWVLGLPLIALLFGLNLLYGFALEQYVGKFPDFEVIQIGLKTHYGLVILAVCIQPAVVEELFFRYLALGKLRSLMGVHGAVWVSAVMFGVAHLGAFLSVPILILIGAGLGYARVYSGGLALPMLMHALHNFAVLLVEGHA